MSPSFGPSATHAGRGRGSGTEPRVEFADLGGWGGVMLAAEYDAEDDTIRVNVRAVARIRGALGDAEAHRFSACAVAHERFHRAHPGASEAAARASAAAETDTEPGRYETILAGCVATGGAGFAPPSRVNRKPPARAARA